MRVGILGAGFMGGTHARAFAKNPDVEVVWVSSRSLEKALALAQEVGAKATTDDGAIIHDDSLDAVSITLPTHLHPQFTIAALEAGKHVLLEKPLALTTDDCDKIIAASAKSDGILMVAHTVRFWAEYVRLVEMVRSGKLGKPLSATASRLSVPPGWAEWFQQPELSGGAVLDLMAHDLDALNWALGTPATIYARGQEAKPGLWQHALTIVDYGESSGFIEGSELMPDDYPFTATFRVLCEDGSIEYTFRAGGVSVEMGGANTLMIYEPGRSYQIEVEGGDAYETQIGYFVNCARDGKAPEMGTVEQARLAVRMANAMVESLETGAVVTI